MAEQTQTLGSPTASPVITRQRGFASKQFQENFWVVIATLIAIIGLVAILFPIFWMFSTSLKGEIEALKMPPNWIPAEWRWYNYRDALTFTPFNLFFWNTFQFAFLVMVGELLSCSFISYGFARLRAPGRNALFLLVLATLMIPGEATLIPQFILFSRLNWLDTYLPLIVPTWFGSAYLIFLMRQFYMTLPKEYDEAAIIEGASHLQIWWKIALPLSKPALGALGIMSFIFHWNTFQTPLIYINSNELFPVSLGLSMFRSPFGGTPWHWYMAASLSVIVPCIVVFYVAQRFFIQGIVVSGVKG